MTLTVAVAHGLRRFLLNDSIYSLKLARRGHYIPQALQANPHLMHHLSDMQLQVAAVLSAATTPDHLAEQSATNYVVLVDGPRIVGVLSPERRLARAEEWAHVATLADAAEEDFITIRSDSTIFNLLASMQLTRASVAVVLKDGDDTKVLGVVTLGLVAEIVAEGMEMFTA